MLNICKREQSDSDDERATTEKGLGRQNVAVTLPLIIHVDLLAVAVVHTALALVPGLVKKGYPCRQSTYQLWQVSPVKLKLESSVCAPPFHSTLEIV